MESDVSTPCAGSTEAATPPAVEDAAIGEVIPDGAKATLNELKRVQGLPDRNNPEWRRLRTARVELLARHLHNLGNLPAVAAKTAPRSAQLEKVWQVVIRDCANEIAGWLLPFDMFTPSLPLATPAKIRASKASVKTATCHRASRALCDACLDSNN